MNPSSSFSSASSSASATVRVEKATSEFLIGPDWTMNIDICDTINSSHWLAKDVVKAVKKRLQHKNPKVQLLALTLLETMVKNCGDYVHFQIVERNILQEMVKIVKKKIDMHVREKILTLLNSWQEAFGGPGGKHPQYYWAYEELRRSGVEFPHRTADAAPIFTPPVTIRHAQADYGMPSNSSTRLDEAMASELENLSLSSINSMQNVLDLLSDMLQAVNQNDCAAVKDEVIVDLVDRCRANQKKLMQMLTTTGDEELLGQGLELNDSLQNVLAKHDAIVSGSMLPNQVEFSPPPTPTPSAPLVAVTRNQIEEEGEEEDDFAQLARRHTKMRSTTTQVTSIGTSEGISNSKTSSASAASAPSLSNALTLADPPPPAPVRTTKEQDMVDFLSITLSKTATSPHTPPPIAYTQTPVSATTQEYPYANNYVVPWAQTQPQQPQSQPQPWPQTQPHSQFSSGYPPPPWAATPRYYSSQNPMPTYSTPRANTSTSYMPLQGTRPSFTARGSNGSVAINGDARVISTPTGTAPVAGHKPFVPSYRLFEDLNVLGNPDGRFRTSSNTCPSLSGTSSQSMVGGRK